MGQVKTDDGVTLYFEEAGTGEVVIFVHEFAGDLHSWSPQMRFFSRRYRCIAYNARGFPPSDVPNSLDAYSQARATDDIRCVLDELGVEKAHVVGLSMGGFATLHFGLTYPERALSLVVAGCGYGAERSKREQFRAEADVIAENLRNDGIEAFTQRYSVGPTRVQYQNKDPMGWREFADALGKHSAEGAAFTQQGVQKERPSIYDLEAPMRELHVPTLILTGDEDWPCLTPNVFMKETIPSAGLVVLPNTGHAANLEEPERFNRELADFFAQVTSGRWPMRDPRAQSASITGMGDKD
ncbi:MAG: alpha/beta hydrolase [Gammaproteobacteria bacterium]|nr:alpha/beta hydrolase [Gammaproteobacteria bacterium]